jgi:hypothetical protein
MSLSKIKKLTGAAKCRVEAKQLSTKSNVYSILEIPREKFYPLMKPMYDIYEGRKTFKSELDPFMKQSYMSFGGMTEEQYEKELEIIQRWKALTMSWGNFHQKIIGLFPDWEDYKTGHSTKCDNGRRDGTAVVEVKNHVNTMNSGGKETVFKNLEVQIALGKRALLVIINGNFETKKHENGIEEISGKNFYNELSGREDFMKSLLETVKSIFATYKTYDELIGSLETS